MYEPDPVDLAFEDRIMDGYEPDDGFDDEGVDFDFDPEYDEDS